MTPEEELLFDILTVLKHIEGMDEVMMKAVIGDPDKPQIPEPPQPDPGPP